MKLGKTAVRINALHIEDGYALDSSGAGESQIVVTGDATLLIIR